MNEDLRQEGKLYDPKTGKGQEYLWQDDSDKDSVMEGKKGLVRQRRPPGSRRHLRLHQGHLMNGKIVSVDTWDVNENKAALDTKAMDDIEKTVNNKWIPR
ncbi:hypothetical protein H4W23_34375 [Streptomyces gardneri]|nr:hypothetical protein H4W23_34375 [Streptomyces gardneri]